MWNGYQNDVYEIVEFFFRFFSKKLSSKKYLTRCSLGYSQNMNSLNESFCACLKFSFIFNKATAKWTLCMEQHLVKAPKSTYCRAYLLLHNAAQISSFHISSHIYIYYPFTRDWFHYLSPFLFRTIFRKSVFHILCSADAFYCLTKSHRKLVMSFNHTTFTLYIIYLCTNTHMRHTIVSAKSVD